MIELEESEFQSRTEVTWPPPELPQSASRNAVRHLGDDERRINPVGFAEIIEGT